jgi:GNAT superfamily N-acetyltransferase
VRIREVDASTAPDEELLGLHALEKACAPVGGEPFRPPELSLAYYRHSPARVRRHFFADERSLLVGAATLSVFGPSFVYADLLVLPPYRRQGVGTALFQELLAGVREVGASSFFGHHWSEDGAAFALHVGARDDQRDIRATLDLRSAELPEPSVPAGWRLLSWIGAAPDDLVESYTRCRDAMSDAPDPAGAEFPETTVHDVREIEETAAKRGREMRVTVVIDERNEVAAFTDLRVTPGATTAGTDDTAVAAWARGRGIGRAVKLEALRRLRADRPEVETVTTMNAEGNAAMRHINTRIGFVPTVILTSTVLTL